MSGLVGRTLAHYRVNTAIGAGGMGEVYRATDTKLGRDVALKVLPSEMASDPDRLARFQREARAIAALNHPNVVTVYSVEEADNVHFITMELIEGQALDRLISSDGLPVDRIVEIAGALAEALAAAHEKGILHRDLKPANVMVTNEGRVKVLDFGLAKDVGTEKSNDATLTSAGHTQAGVVMGTPAYMSPEQVSGRTLDHRTDIFSLGVMLYEMATGHRPFGGTSSAELISSILRDSPPSVTDVRPELPADLARVIRRCLEKEPRHRVQTARDVSNEFRDLARTSTRPTPVSTSAARAAVAADSGTARADEGFWIAVLPFKYSGTNADLMALAEGLPEEVITGLSRFSYLRVIARSSTARYASQSVDVRGAGRELNARYVMEGTLRQAGSKLRLAVQLVDTVSGAHLWAENYERAFTPEAVFELQDDLVPRIVSTVADINGVLPRSMSETLRSRSPEQLSPYEAVLRSFGYFERVTAEELNAAIAGIESAVQKAPTYADAWAMLALLSVQRHAQGFGPADSLTTGAAAARKAVDAASANHLAWFSLAQVLFFQKEFRTFRNAADRALALNPMDSNSLAFHGEMLAYSGDWERGLSLAERARQINPHHPGWYWHVNFNHAYRQRDYRAALEIASKMNQTSNWGAHLLTAAACGQLGDHDGATRALREVLKLRPDIAAAVRPDADKWFDAEHAAHLIEGLLKAGLELPEGGVRELSTSAAATTQKSDSGAARTDEGFWVAVLPFKYTSANQDLKALSEGLSEEVITGLSRFSYLRVIARGSTAKYSSESGDVRAMGKELGARYVMEGSLRQAGSKFRLAVQLVDAVSGAHLWAENYERSFSPEAIFEIQDDLVPRIVATVADAHGVLHRAMSQAVRGKNPEELTAYEALLRTLTFAERISAEEHAIARTCAERAVQLAPNLSQAWAVLAQVYAAEYGHLLNPQPEPLERALKAAQRAVDADPANAGGHCSLAYVLFLRKQFQAFRIAAEHALELNPNAAGGGAVLGLCMAYSGDWERGCAVVERAMQINPRLPGWCRFPAFYNAYRKRDYQEAIRIGLKLNLPGLPAAHSAMAAAYGQAGDLPAAQKELQELRRVMPNTADVLERIRRWQLPEMTEHIVDGLRKAGLEILESEATASHTVSPLPSLSREKPDSGAARADEGFWVAVLPFKYIGGTADLAALAEGLTDDIVTNMSKFSYLRVIARSSTARYAKQAVDIRTAAKELGARYVMEGSIRQAGPKIRIAVQLVDAENGAGLWAETYDRAFNPDATLDLLDDVVPRIVATVGDTQGVLPHSMTDALRNRDPESLTPYEALLRSLGYHQRVSAAEHLAARTALERAVKQPPERADCWAMLSWLYRAEYSHGFNMRPDPLGRALAAARHAVDLAPANQLAHAALASTLFYRREFAACRVAAERAVALNRMEGYTTAFVAMQIAFSGDWDTGCGLAERSTQLNPNHPGWYWLPLVFNAYRQRDGKRALEFALKVNMPEFWLAQLALAVIYVQLGEMEHARVAVRDLLTIRPNFASIAREELEKWWLPDMVEQMLGDLGKAGLEVDDPAKPTSIAAAATATATGSGAMRADEGFWVAVLPFKYMGSNTDLPALAGGLTEEVITGLSRFSYLRVIARGSTAKYSSESGDVRVIGKELGARYVMEGSLRQAGSAIRLAVQLVDATTGAHLWAETFERAFRPDGVFALQDQLVPGIVSTVADQHGILPRSIGAAIRKKSDDQLSPYEAVFRVFSLHETMTAQEHAACRDLLERAVRDAPDAADCWAMLATLYSDEDWFGFNLRPDPMGRAAAAAQRAAELAPASALAVQALAQSLFMRHEWQAFRPVAERTIALNPMEGATVALMGILLACSGDWERGCAVADSAMKLHPNFPGWYWLGKVFNAYRMHDYRAAIDAALRIQMPGYFWTSVVLTAAHGQLGERQAAQKALRELLAVRPNFAAAARRELEKWFELELVEHFMDGLRKAGLDIPDDPPTTSANSECK